MAAVVAAHIAGNEQRHRNIAGVFGCNVGNDAALIFVGADIIDRDLALALWLIARGFSSAAVDSRISSNLSAAGAY